MRYTREEQAQHRAELVEALRSGKYKQGDGMLRQATKSTEDLFCCLGVACDLSGLGEWQESAAFEQDGKKITFKEYHVIQTELTQLPPAVKDYYGFAHPIGRFSSDDYEHGSLTAYNDNGYPFAFIADLIEDEPRGLVLVEEVATP